MSTTDGAQYGPPRETPSRSAGVTAEGPIRGLNPTDGLFLRAEHLEAIQQYAASVSAAVGRAAGSGVVNGFQLTLTGERLEVSPGLALNSLGQPLLSHESVRLSVDVEHRPPVGPNGFWVVEITPDILEEGTDNVYGSPCADPCEGGGATIRPWTRSVVNIALRTDDMPGLNTQRENRRRNWLASQFFDRERRQADPWLVPNRTPGTVPGTLTPLGSRNWRESEPAPAEPSVPIGVLQVISGTLTLDVWTARREVGGSPSDDRWRGHLAMRPWQVFMAQLLQFQDQLSSVQDLVPDRKPDPDVAQLAIQEFLAGFSENDNTRKRKSVKRLAEVSRQLEAAAQSRSHEGSLSELGLSELPPAGYLPVSGDLQSIRDRVHRLLGENMDIGICAVRADHVAGAVQAARHLDRIPLDGGNDTTAVDVLVPNRAADLELLKVEAYGWVAFVRRSDAACNRDVDLSPPADGVLLRAAFMTMEEAREFIEESESLPDDPGSLPTLTYDDSTAEEPSIYPERPLDVQIIGIVGIASDDLQVDLTTRRAKRLAASWGFTDDIVEGLTAPFLDDPVILLCQTGFPG